MKLSSKISIAALGILSSGIFFSVTIFAVELPAQTNNRGAVQISPKPVQTASSTAILKKEQAKNRLAGARLKSCQAREAGIRTRSESLKGLIDNMLIKFDSIAQRVKDYYTAKLIPEGITVADYDSLVAEIQTKKLAVETALALAGEGLGRFSCSGDEPKAVLTQFNLDMRKTKDALRDYRTSVKDLIVAVRSSRGAESSQKDTPESSASSKPSKSPKGGRP